jgi:hypothetical protein
MAVFARVGSFNRSQDTGAFSQDVTHRLGVTPKAMILFMSGATTAGFRTDKANPTIGFVGSDRVAYSVSMGIAGAAADADSGKRTGTAALYVSAHGGQGITEGDITAWDSDKFTITWADSADEVGFSQGGQYLIGYLILGGDISAKALTKETVAATGNLAVTGAGFQPTAAFIAQAGGNGTMDGGGNFGQLNFGATDGTSQWVIGQEAQDANTTTNEYSWQRGDRLIATTSANAYNSLATFGSFDADGMTVSYDDAPSAGWELIYLVLSGVTLSVGAFNKSTSPTNTQDVTKRTTAITIADHGRFAIGFSDGVREVSGGITSQDNVGTSVVNAYMSSTKAFQKVNNDTGTVDAAGDFTGGTGEFTIDWSTNDAVATEFFYVAIQATIPLGGGGGGGGGGGQGGQGGGGGNSGGNGGGNGGGGPGGGGGPPGQTRRTIIGSQRRRRRSLIGIF